MNHAVTDCRRYTPAPQATRCHRSAVENRWFVHGCFLLLVFAASVGAEFPKIVNSQKPGDTPPTPQEAAAKIIAPDGFKVTLFAGEPDVQQPMGIDIDDRGRLWIAENYTYTGRTYTNEFNDRIIILEDKDNDGRHDSRTVFWDKGMHLSSVCVGFGGVWIINDGKLQFIADKDRNDVPDGEPVTLLDGFDHAKVQHNIANGLMWGPDGWLYGRHGIQADSNVGAPGTPVEKRTKLNCSIWRYHITRKVFEVVVHGTTNPWGLDFDDYGQAFFTNNVNGHLWHMVPGARYERMKGRHFNPYLYELIPHTADHQHWDTGKKWHQAREAKGKTAELGGGHSHCGGMIYLGDNWPDKYRNKMFMFNTHGRRVNQNVLARKENGEYVGKRAPDLLFANQQWFKGVELKYGSDGGVYMTDWTDLGECHDHDGVHRTSGRIYKVVCERKLRHEKRDLQSLGDMELATLLGRRNDWYVRKARRILHERAIAGTDMSKVHGLLKTSYRKNTAVTRRLRAIWALYVTGGADAPWLIEQTNDESEHVRVWAIRLLVDDRSPDSKTVERLVEMAKSDSSGLVRLYLASALHSLKIADRWALAQALLMRDGQPDGNWQLVLWYGLEPAVAADSKRAIQLAAVTKYPKVRQFIARRVAEAAKK